jgi:hypothetical protein
VSEKIGLVQLEAAQRLVGWTLVSGSNYVLSGFEYSVIIAIEDSGEGYSAVGSVAALTPGSYYLDRQARALYVRSLDGSNPSGLFLTATVRLFFSNVGVNLAHDLASGFDVEWLPLLKSTSSFGVAIDNTNQLGEAIEGTGQVLFYNDLEFWRPRFDKLYFENQRVLVYSWNRSLPASEAKCIYRGSVQGKSYSAEEITFDLADILNGLRAPVSMDTLSSIVDARIPDGLELAFQRRLYGYVQGHRPANIDQVLDAYPLTGTFSLDFNGTALTGSGTAFLDELSPGDQILLEGDDGTQSVAIDSISSNTAAVISEAYSSSSKVNVSATVKPSEPKTYTNRVFKVAGHALCEPTKSIARVINTSMIELDSVDGLWPEDELLIDGEETTITRISDRILKLSTSLLSPEAGDTVARPAISNVYLDSSKLQSVRDYTYDAAAATLTLDPLAEFNVAKPKTIRGTVTFVNGNRTITGSATFFTADLKSGDWIKASGESDYFKVLSVTDDTHAVLRTVATYSVSLAALIKRPNYYVEGTTVLTCDVLGLTDDGTTSGRLLYKAAQIVGDLMNDADLTELMDTDSFALAENLAEQRLGFAIPDHFGDTDAPILRDVINKVNQSVFGTLFQNADFQLQYSILSPNREDGTTRFDESDLLTWSIEASSERIARTSNVDFAFREYDPLSLGPSNLRASAESLPATYLAKTSNEFSVQTYLVDEGDAQIFANRWAFIFEVSAAVITFQSKLQAARLNINDTVSLSHEKLYERVGSSANLKVGAVRSATKTALGSEIELEDLANAFTRCGVIAADSAPDYADATDREKSYAGYITDTFGMIANDPETFGINLIW